MGRVPEHPAHAYPPRTGGWAEAEALVAQRILSGPLIQWSRVRFPRKPSAAPSLPWPPSEQGETSTVARWPQEDMVLGPKLAARPGLPTVQPTVRAKLNTAQLFARTHDRTAGRPTRMGSKVLFASVAYNLHHLAKYLQLDERRVKSNKK